MSLRYLSLFSGLEAAHLAWQPLGWTCAAVAEIDPPACAVLAHRLPGVPNLGDVSKIGDRQIAALGHIDVVIGGSPCQDLSVAGKRAGLAGARSGLFHEQLRIFHAARHLCGSRWLVWENVPGAFSSNKGRDFAVVAGALAGCELDVPTDGWGSEGVALGDNGLVEWSVLDAQWFGVAQRRRRVFAVLDTGDWSSRPPVLLEPESLRGDYPPRREAGQGAPAGAVRSVALRGRDGGGTAELGDEVGGTLRADGFDASEDGTGRGTPLVPVPFDTTQITSRANGSNPQPGDPCHPLTAGGHAPALAFNWQSGGDCRGLEPAETTNALHCGQTPAALSGMAVRRLTPRECERLQAAPDDWTLVPNAKGKPMADGPRYKMIGNSFAVPVIRWIGERIQAAHAHSEAEVA